VANISAEPVSKAKCQEPHPAW